jgi:DNA-binding NarL/FixJ family response regulator
MSLHEGNLIGVIEDNDVFRNNIAEYFFLHNQYYLAFAVANVEDITSAIFTPDIILLDIHLNGQNSLDRFFYIKETFKSAKIIVMTGDVRDELILKAFEAGAKAYIRKPFAMEELLDVVKGIHENGSFIAPKMATAFLDLIESKASNNFSLDQYNFSTKELEIAQFLRKGLNYVEIAHKLNISMSSLHAQMRNMYVKGGVESKTKFVALLLNAN